MKKNIFLIMGLIVSNGLLAACSSSNTLAPVESLTPNLAVYQTIGSTTVQDTVVQNSTENNPTQLMLSAPVHETTQSTQYFQYKSTPTHTNAIKAVKASSQNTTYTVNKGDTLYSIAWQAGMDYEDLAALNHINAPYTLSVGQVLQLQPTKKAATSSATPAASFQTIFWSPKSKQASTAKPVVKQTTTQVITKKPVFSWRPQGLPKKAEWQWPVYGKVVAIYSMAPGGNRGLNIVAPFGAPIKAAAAGQVVYSGNGIRGYGNIILVKNTGHFLTAYAYNARNLVHDGQWVKRGQTIATMGRNMSGQVMLHFEIRLYGKAVDPMRYLPARSKS